MYKKLTKTVPRAKVDGPMWAGDGHDQDRVRQAHDKRKRRAARNLRLVASGGTRSAAAA